MPLRSLSAVRPRCPRAIAAVAAAGLTAVALATPVPASAAALGPVGGPRLAAPGVITDLGAGVAAPPAVASLSYVVADGTTGAILAAKAPHLREPPASTLKTLLALVVMPRLEPARTYRAADADVRIEGSKVGIVPGGTYTVRQLWQAVFLRSGNDAVSSLAALDGGTGATVARMRATARALGALDTTVVNTTGLDADGQLSSAYDLALFGRAALGRPDLLGYAGTVHTVFPGKVVPARTPRPTFQLWNEQKFVLRYPGAIGIKNGFTTKAANTLIAASRRNGRTVLVTLTKSHRNAWKDASALSDWAYAYGGGARPVGHLVAPGEVDRPAAGQAPAAPAVSPPPAQAPGAMTNRVSAGLGALPTGRRSPLLIAGYVAGGLAAALVLLRTRVLIRRRRRG